MKFKYNDNTYVVFADIDEITSNQLLIKVEDDFLYYLSVNECEKLKPTHVLKHILQCKGKILRAYEVEIKNVAIDTFYAESLEGTLSDSAELLTRLAKRFSNTNIKFTNDCDRAYYSLIKLIEETEEQVKARVSYSSLDDIKYFKL